MYKLLNKNPQQNSTWSWIPSLYFAEGFPYVLVMTVSVAMYKDLGISNADIAFFTSWLYLPWVIKPIFSPFIDILKTKRWWIILTQILLGAGMAGIAFSLDAPFFFELTLAAFWLLAFSSATHDIAADGFYMIALDEEKQSLFVGIRSIFYRIATIAGQGGLLFLAGELEQKTGNITHSWTLVFYLAAATTILIALYHLYILPKPSVDKKQSFSNIGELFITFIKKENIIIALSFVLLYRLGESQLAKIAIPFFKDNIADGGLGLTTDQIGIVYGTIGTLCLIFGGILGGILIAKNGLKFWLWPMVIAMNLPNLCYVYLAYYQPESHYIISTAIAIEQFGYGVGFSAFMMYLIYVAKGPYKTSHYAFLTGFMAMGMMLPGMFAGIIQEEIGYTNFFIWVCICTLPGIILTAFLKIPEKFGKKNSDE